MTVKCAPLISCRFWQRRGYRSRLLELFCRDKGLHREFISSFGSGRPKAHGFCVFRTSVEAKSGRSLVPAYVCAQDGFEATRLIRAEEQGRGRRHLIVALTASALEEDQRKCADAGQAARAVRRCIVFTRA